MRRVRSPRCRLSPQAHRPRTLRSRFFERAKKISGLGEKSSTTRPRSLPAAARPAQTISSIAIVVSRRHPRQTPHPGGKNSTMPEAQDDYVALVTQGKKKAPKATKPSASLEALPRPLKKLRVRVHRSYNRQFRTRRTHRALRQRQPPRHPPPDNTRLPISKSGYRPPKIPTSSIPTHLKPSEPFCRGAIYCGPALPRREQ